MEEKIGVEISEEGSEEEWKKKMIIGKRNIRKIVREMIGVKEGLVIVEVNVDGEENEKCEGKRKIMIERVKGKNGMEMIDIEIKIVLKKVKIEEEVKSREIVIIMMFGRIMRIGIDKDSEIEEDFVIVLKKEDKEKENMVELKRKIGIEKGLIELEKEKKKVII